ncbi:deoxynucleoside kinase [Streptomyces sp. PCS3-D2]|uniref:deoxynucleoside kinase n=1 Tax=Streptomyces sp. PCS3-D2 TaxID=1460244 RepID=UPI00272CBCA1|nr:deoxynucleoside kinase [Streptomyces sp. PCS3-D2]WKV70048.1 deoxynucleoside kinase [Streptomyces sp. PCS3-D2]
MRYGSDLRRRHDRDRQDECGRNSLAKELGQRRLLTRASRTIRLLPLFYTASPEEIQARRYPFLLQLYFLQTRFRLDQEAYKQGDNVLDRSIYEDCTSPRSTTTWAGSAPWRCGCNEGLLGEMMREIDGLPYRKAPDLMVYLKADFETVLHRIGLRGP